MSKTILGLIQNDIKKYSNFDDILNGLITTNKETNKTEKNLSLRGFYYERLWDLCIKFGVTDLTLNPLANEQFTTHIFGNTNKDDIDEDKHFWKTYGGFKNYLNENIQSGNSGGYSDITFLNKIADNEILNLISVKYFDKEEKSIDKYDLPKLCTIQQKHDKGSRKTQIYIFVKDKIKAKKVFENQNSSSQLLINMINPKGNYENMYDADDLRKYYFKLRELLAQYNYYENSDDIYNFETSYLKLLKPTFIPRFHQKLFISKVNELIMDEGKQNVLVGAIPRSGKSYIMAGSILEYVKKNSQPDKKQFNFIIITPAPNETFTEYTDIFDNYIDFVNNNIVCKVFKKKITSKDLSLDKHNVIIISKQKLGWSQTKEDNLNDDNTENIKNRINDIFENIINDIDLMYLDEAHFGMATQKAMNILKILETYKKIPKVYVTATYNTPIKKYNITPDCKLTWDINDINIMKNISEKTINDNIIKKRFGNKIYGTTLQYFGDESGSTIYENLRNEYKIFPKPYLITSLWDKDKINIEKKRLGNTNYGFDMGKLFMTKNESFENPEQIKEMLRYYFGKPPQDVNYEQKDFYKKNGILPRIKKICSGKSRTMQEQHMTTQLWFLPSGGTLKGDKFNNKIKALLEILMTPEFRKLDYHYYTYVDGKKGRASNKYITYMKKHTDIKTEIENLEKKLSTGDDDVKGKNLIILTGNRLQLGISLKNVDIVTMWNSISSSDAIFQMLFRSMTEVNEPECDNLGFCKQKKYGFMVDLNPQRAMTNVNMFSENITYNSNTSNIDEYRQIADLIDIDNDKLESFDNNDDFTEVLFNKLYESWDRDIEGIKKITENFNYSADVLNKIQKDLRHIKLSKKNKETIEVLQNDTIDPGKKQEVITENQKKELTQNIKDLKQQDISLENLAAEVLSELISLLNIFTLYLDSGSKCILLNSNEFKVNNLTVISDINKLTSLVLSNNNTKSIFLKILNGRLGGSEEEEYSENVIEILLESIKEKKDISYMEKLIYSQKKQYYGIKKPDKLLEDINNNLTPKDKERKEKGEVFTPIYVVNNMLDKLPPHVWSNPTLKWLDPAVGIGNFPVMIYIRLLEGLNSWEPDEEKRRKHILEKMIFMVEISEKSIFILRKIFCGKDVDGNGIYNLNIHKGSFLEDDYNDMFDVIVGNPPYNTGGVSKGGGVFWKGFVDKSLRLLNNDGYLSMIHPPGWRKPHGQRASAGDIWVSFKQYNLIYLNMDDNKIKHFPKVDYYVLHKTDKKTETIIDNKFEDNNFNGKLNISDLPFIGHFINNEVISILNKLFNRSGDKFNIIYNQNFKPNSEDKKVTSGIPHTFFYDPAINKYKVVHKEYNDEKQLSSSNKGNYFNNKKIVMTFGNGKKPAYLYPIFYDFEIGGTNNTMYQIIEENDSKDNIMVLFNSKLMRFILKLTQYSESPNHKNEFKILNMITKPNEGDIKSEEDLYDFYGINKKEQELINKISEYTKPNKKQNKLVKSAMEEEKVDKLNNNEIKPDVVEMKNEKSTQKNDKPKKIRKIKIKRKLKDQSPNTSAVIVNNTVNVPVISSNTDNDMYTNIEIDEQYKSKFEECIKNGKLWNNDTHRCIKNTTINIRKIRKINKTFKK